MSAESRRDSSAPQTRPLFPEQPPAPLKVFVGDASGTSPPQTTAGGWSFSPMWKMREWVSEIIRQETPAEGTRRRWLDTVGHWERTTLDPPIAEINQATCDRFAAGLMASSLANNTRRTHGVQLNGFLNRLAPPTKHHRRAVGFFDRPPSVDLAPLEIIMGAIKHFTMPEMGRYLDACKLLPPPRKPLAAPLQLLCESLAVVAYNTGLRIKELLAMRFEWMDVIDDFHCINMPSAALKCGRRSGRGRCVPLNEPALRAIGQLRSFTTASGAIFGGVRLYQRFDRYRSHTLRLAGLPSAKRLGFHGLRQLGGEQIRRIDPTMKKSFLGHATQDVTTNFYTSWVELAETVARLPQPAWTAWSGRSQLRLFD
jgi:integrase